MCQGQAAPRPITGRVRKEAMSLLLNIEVGGAALQVTDTDPPMIVLNSVLKAIGVPRTSALRNLARTVTMPVPTKGGVQPACTIRPPDLQAFLARMPASVFRTDRARGLAAAAAAGIGDLGAERAQATRTLPADRDAWAMLSLAEARLQQQARRLRAAMTSRSAGDLKDLEADLDATLAALRPHLRRLAGKHRQ
jgi:hypothetical protein